LKLAQQRRRIIGDSAFGGRKWGEKSDLQAYRTSSIENVPRVNGTRTSAGVRAASFKK
jgi:hypothetical protein